MNGYIAIIQARINSTRLPGKTLLRMPQKTGPTVLERTLWRVATIPQVSQIVLAVPETEEEWEDIFEWEIDPPKNCVLFRGDEKDVLKRHWDAVAYRRQCDKILRVTSDCPFIDAEYINNVMIPDFEEHKPEFMYYRSRNVLGACHAEIFTRKALGLANDNAWANHHREHVSDWLIEGNEPISVMTAPLSHYDKGASVRLTVDTLEDYEALCEMASEIETATTADCVRWLREREK
jgi:spore coat polysaccharide biosynthesis protein SpsF